MAPTLGRALSITLVGALAPLGAHAATPTGPAATPVGVVREFNAALSQRRLDAALALFAPGAVNFQLQSAHSLTGTPDRPEPLTSDLTAHWKSITPILYAMNRRYERVVENATVHADGLLAVVWARIKTHAEPLQGTPTSLMFHETYLLREQDGRWQIVAIANSRQTR
jgi:ketosteroid isomerase-like protein